MEAITPLVVTTSGSIERPSPRNKTWQSRSEPNLPLVVVATKYTRYGAAAPPRGARPPQALSSFFTSRATDSPNAR